MDTGVPSRVATNGMPASGGILKLTRSVYTARSETPSTVISAAVAGAAGRIASSDSAATASLRSQEQDRVLETEDFTLGARYAVGWICARPGW